MTPALWISHSSIEDYLKCPRAYYLKNVYKDPQSRRKIALITPALALGQAVHDTLEALSVLPVADRDFSLLPERFTGAWEKLSGKNGGFKDAAEEGQYKERGLAMLERVRRNPGLLQVKAVRLKQELPSFMLSEAENIMLCGKIDWLKYCQEDDSLHVLDFKTGMREEKSGSMQLPIYCLIVSRCQKRPVSAVSYWYLESSDEPAQMPLTSLEEDEARLLELGRDIRRIRESGYYDCSRGGCFACDPYEEIIAGRAEYVGVSGYERDTYVVS